MPTPQEDGPILVCCGLMLAWRWNEDIWATFCPRCGMGFAMCPPVPAAFAAEVSP